MIIRKAQASEAIRLTELAMRSKASNGYDDAFMAACRDELAIGTKSFDARELWVAVDGSGAIVGFFGLWPSDDHGLCEADPVFVEPRLKSMGIGRMLWLKLEERARHFGASSIGLDADPDAVPYYSRMGCSIVGVSPSQSIPGRLLPRMVKKL